MASNGRLDLNTLTPVTLTNGGTGYLERGTAQSWYAARSDLIRTTGVTPVIIEDGLYRDYARQVYWKTYWTRLGKPQNAATPGASNHGLALCVDINNISAYNQNVLDTVMARHGFIRDTSETWHYHHTSTNPADSGSTPITQGVLMALTDAEQDELLVKTRAVYDALFTQSPTSRGTSAGVLTVLGSMSTTLNAVKDGTFLDTTTSFGTPGGTLKTLRAITDKLGITNPN